MGAMKGTILIALALLVASCQMKPAKHFLIETKTKTDDEPARKEEDYQNWGNQGGIHNSGTNNGNMGGSHLSGDGNTVGSFGQSGGHTNTNQRKSAQFQRNI